MVITDYTMPNLSGENLAIKMKKTRPDIPLTLCTGYNDGLGEKEATAIGIKSFFNETYKNI